MVFSSGSSAFENVLGISSIDVTLKNRHSATGDGYPYASSPLDNSQNAKTYLNFEHSELIAKVKNLFFHNNEAIVSCSNVILISVECSA